jgi:CBS domain-containing protein
MEVLDRVSAILKYKGREISFIAPDVTVYEAVEMMANREIGALLVMDGDKLVGLLSERDYARKIILKGRSSRDTKVNEIMISPAITIRSDCSVQDAMRTMTERRIRHLPVIGSDGAVVGIVSIGDLVKWIITSQDQTIEQLQSYIAGA